MSLFSVPDMSCGHCKASITQALTGVAGLTDLKVDLENRQLETSGSVADAAVIRILQDIGFPAAIVATS